MIACSWNSARLHCSGIIQRSATIQSYGSVMIQSYGTQQCLFTVLILLLMLFYSR